MNQHKPFDCPQCFTELTAATEMEGRDVSPKPRDFFMCIWCGAFMRYDANLEPVPASEDDLEELAELAPSQLHMMLTAQKRVREMRGNRMTPPKEDYPTDYIPSIHRMADTVREWGRKHPNENTLVQFNYPNNVMLIATIDDAIEQGFVSVNDNGRKLITELKGVCSQPPTSLMVRVAMESCGMEGAS